MPTSSFPANPWTHPSYELRVRGTIYLWGSAGMSRDLTFQQPLHFHIRNDVFGEPVTIGTQVASGDRTSLGTLQPGECVTIPLQKLSGVFATCALGSSVSCLIRD